ncbi:MAG TPA: oxygenase MpaB family protein [Terracidiphilus sp.]|nr:oxygenase MpaB family protein [Terracidiphilus sp.]
MNQNPAALVSEQDSEAMLARVARLAAGQEAGIFGPDSLAWRVNREAALFLGAGRAALLQLAHPWVAAALAEHSTVLNRPIARFHNTFRIVFTMVFGTLEQALAAARHLYSLHTHIAGRMPEDVARYRRGSRYEANEVSALRWVFATLVESAVVAYDAVLPPLTAEEREQYYAEECTLAGLFGIAPEALPENWEAFAAYNREMHASDALGASAGAREIARKLLSGAGSWIHPPPWYRALTAAWMPPRFREEFGLAFGEPERRSAERALRRLPRIYQKLPKAARFAGPWREAQTRLENRGPGWLTKCSNRFWIGEPRMPFGDAGAQSGHGTETAILK